MLCIGKGTSVLVRAKAPVCCWCYWRQTAVRLESSAAASLNLEVAKNSKPFSDIPGPKGLPYFGTYFRYKRGQLDIYQLPKTLTRWHRQYGGIVKETLLGNTVVHVFDPDAIRTVYANEDKWPRIEPMAETTQMYRLKAGMSPGLGNTNDEEWYRLRSAVQQLMMRPKEVLPFLPGADAVALDFVSHLKQLRDHSNEVPDFATELSRWSLESAGMHCYHTRLGYLEEKGRGEAVEMVRSSHTVFDVTAQLQVCLPWHKYLTTPKWSKLVAAEDILSRCLHKHLTAALERLRAKTDNKTLAEHEYHFLRYLLSREELTLNDIATLTLSLFTDGLPTTTQQMMFLLYLLATNPGVQEKLYEEVCSLVPPSSGPITSDCIGRMSYLRACIKESVRMMSMVNEISRITKKDMVLCGYHIPAETTLHLLSPAQYRNPEFFAEPDTFMPERWLRGWTGAKPHPFLVLPFGHGPRMCAGRRFAEQDMAVLLTRILQNFRLEWHHAPMGIKYSILNIPDCPAQYTLLDR